MMHFREEDDFGLNKIDENEWYWGEGGNTFALG